MPGARGMPDKAAGMPNGAPRMPNGAAPGVPPGTEAGSAGVPLGEFALLDVDRRRRTGVPEVVFGEGKTSEQIFALLAELRARDPEAPALATRCPAPVLDGAATPGELVAEAARLGVEVLALTDHDGIYGVPQFAQAAARLAGVEDVRHAHRLPGRHDLDVDAGQRRLLGHKRANPPAIDGEQGRREGCELERHQAALR